MIRKRLNFIANHTRTMHLPNLFGKTKIPSPCIRRHEIKVVIETPWNFTERAWLDGLNGHFPDWKLKVDLEFHADLCKNTATLADADIISALNLNPWLPQSALQVKWFNSIFTGIDENAMGLLPGNCRITSSRGIAADSMAEYALMHFLALRNKFAISLQKQRDWTWNASGLLTTPGPLTEQTVVVVGMGPAGIATARLFRSVGCRLIGISNHHASESNPCHATRGYHDLYDTLPETDLLVLTSALTEETRNLIGKTQIDRMKKTAILVNISRGQLVDELALAQALKSGRIAGAGLDVLQQEPPDNRHPLRGADNFTLTPHVSGHVGKFATKITERFARNLKAYMLGEELDGESKRPNAAKDRR